MVGRRHSPTSRAPPTCVSPRLAGPPAGHRAARRRVPRLRPLRRASRPNARRCSLRRARGAPRNGAPRARKRRYSPRAFGHGALRIRSMRRKSALRRPRRQATFAGLARSVDTRVSFAKKYRMLSWLRGCLVAFWRRGGEMWKRSAIQTEFPYASSSAEGFRERQVSRVSGFWLTRVCDRVGDRASHSHTPVTFHTHHKQDGCFRCYHPLPEGASARGTPARSRRARDARFRTPLPRDAREKKPYPRVWWWTIARHRGRCARTTTTRRT